MFIVNAKNSIGARLGQKGEELLCTSMKNKSHNIKNKIPILLQILVCTSVFQIVTFFYEA